MRFRHLLTALAGGSLLLMTSCSGGDSDNSVPLPDLTPFTPEEAERLHAIRDGIAELRGLAVVEGLEEGSISREQWQEYSRAGIDALSNEDREELAHYNSVWHLMKVIEPEADIFELSTTLSGSIVTGFYRFEEQALILVDDVDGGELSVSDESTMAHEYVHSFQDAHFDLVAFLEPAKGDDEAITELGSTLSCVFEGDASLASTLYMFQEHGFTWLTEEVEGAEQAVETVAAVPPILVEYSSFNYDECVDFVLLVQDRDGWAGVDALYERPPVTTEQILHVQKYYDNEEAMEMPDSDLSRLLGDAWERHGVSAFGEYDVRTFLAAASPDVDAAGAADGWGGGRMATYRDDDADGEETLLHISLRWDTAEDFEEFGQAFSAALMNQGWNLGQASDHWYWGDGDNFGYALLDPEVLHYDIIFSTDSGAADIARAALQQELAVAR